MGNLLGEEGMGFKQLMSNFNHERLLISQMRCARPPPRPRAVPPSARPRTYAVRCRSHQPLGVMLARRPLQQPLLARVPGGILRLRFEAQGLR